MTEREKVISDVVSAFDDWENNRHCPGDDWSDVHQSRDMVIALLKAQEPVEPKIVDTVNSKLYHNDMFKNYYCGNCGEFLHTVNRKDLFCSQCGKAVKWE